VDGDLDVCVVDSAERAYACSRTGRLARESWLAIRTVGRRLSTATGNRRGASSLSAEGRPMRALRCGRRGVLYSSTTLPALTFVVSGKARSDRARLITVRWRADALQKIQDLFPLRAVVLLIRSTRR
jgi:hypothetical protein